MSKYHVCVKRSLLTYIIIRFEPAEPTMFRVGDLVEVHMTAIVVSVRDGRFKMILQLRSLALLDASFTNVSGQAINRKT